MSIQRMNDVDLAGKRVLIRQDLNVPLADGEVSSDARIRAGLPTIQQALKAGAAVILMSHLGRPKEGQFSEAHSLAPVARYLGSLLGREVPLLRNWREGLSVEPGEVVMLENVRFEAGE